MERNEKVKKTTNMKVCDDDVSKNIMVVLIWSREQYDNNKESAVPGSQTSALAKIGLKYVSTNKNSQGVITEKSKNLYKKSQKGLHSVVYKYLCKIKDPIAKNPVAINNIIKLTNEYIGVYSSEDHQNIRVNDRP
jgi:hypothetical protein